MTSEWTPFVRKHLMGTHPCMKMAGIFDLNGNKLATSSCFLPPSSEIATLREVISNRATAKYNLTGVELEGVRYAVLSNQDNVLKMKAKPGQGHTFSCCVVLCRSVIVLGISDDAVVKGKGADIVMHMADYITDNTPNVKDVSN